jgi:uncharacterized membrane protein YfcA
MAGRSGISWPRICSSPKAPETGLPLPQRFFLVFVSGLIAGFINVNAGGGSLITVPALIFLGLPPGTANGTNRIAILAGALSALKSYGRRKPDMRYILNLAVPAVIGALAGSSVAVRTPDRVFRFILSGVIILVLTAAFLKPRSAGTQKQEIPVSARKRMLIFFLFLLVGFYGGFIQAGVGMLIMAALGFVSSSSLVDINFYKMFVVAIYTVFAILVFGKGGKIDLMAGLVLAAGNSLGSYAGAKAGIKKGDAFVRLILVLISGLMALKLTGLF